MRTGMPASSEIGATSMTTEERNRYREYIRRWERVGPLLSRIRIQEMRAPDYAEDWRIIDSLYEIGLYHCCVPRTTSGLVEQQRLFAKARIDVERELTE